MKQFAKKNFYEKVQARAWPMDHISRFCGDPNHNQNPGPSYSSDGSTVLGRIL